VKLAYDAFKPSAASYLSSRPPLLIIHGLFGSKRNWQSIAKAICRKGQQVSTVSTVHDSWCVFSSNGSVNQIL